MVKCISASAIRRAFNFVLHAVAMDLKKETFGRPLDKLLIAALAWVPLRSEKPQRMQ